MTTTTLTPKRRTNRAPSVAFQMAREDALEAITKLQFARDTAAAETRSQIDAAILILRRITE